MFNVILTPKLVIQSIRLRYRKNVRNNLFNFALIFCVTLTSFFSSSKLSNTANYTDWRGLKNGKPYVKIKCNETALYYWIMQYSDCVKVMSPASFVDKIKEGLKKGLERYE